MRAIVPPVSGKPGVVPAPADDIASTVSPRAPDLGILLFGIRCGFSSAALDRLLTAGARLVGVATPGPPGLAAAARVQSRRTLPLAGQPARGDDLVSRAHDAGVPVLQVGNLRAADTLTALSALAPDVIVVACYPRRIPDALRAIAPLGAFNIHPSLLPDKRGPDPLFWTLREGSGAAGVTVHELSDRYDAGPIVAQRAHHYADGTLEAELDRALAQLGADVALDALRDIAAGRSRSTPQDDALATWAPWPTDADFIIDQSRPAREAFNFARGVAGRGVPIMAMLGGQPTRILEAHGYSSKEVDAPEGAAALRCNPGWLLARVAAPEAGG